MAVKLAGTVAILITLLLTAAPTAGAESDLPNELVVRLSDPLGHTQAQLAATGDAGALVPADARKRFSWQRVSALNQSIVTLGFDSSEDAARALEALQGDPRVQAAEYNVTRELLWEPESEPLYPDQLSWIEPLDLPTAWNLTSSDEEVVVAIIDSGVSPTHPDLTSRLLPGYNAIDGSANSADVVSHGTHIAGIIAADGSNGIGTAGVAMDARILPVRVVADNGSITIDAIVAGIYWALENGADILNLSFGAVTPSVLEHEAVVAATNMGVPVIASAGNAATKISYPASYPETISVGALTDAGNRSNFSSVVSRVDVAAPGELIFSPYWSNTDGDGWGEVDPNGKPVSGTSFSSAIVSGVVALIESIQPNLSVESVRALLTSTAIDSGDPGPEAGVGAGLVNAEAALRTAAFNAMYDTWYPVDYPVASGQVTRTWLWGVDPPEFWAYEEYADSPKGVRLVYYYDKSRMELTDPLDLRDDGWYITNGLLVNELISGELQVGDDSFEQREPAVMNVAGDPDDVTGPTYASFEELLDAPPVADALPITETIARDGTTGQDSRLLSYGVVSGPLIPETNHRVATVFWDYLNSTGPIAAGDGLAEERLFDPWFYATGFPMTEAYWTQTLVEGVVQDVLVQCFERRCLTYTPANDDGWRVEMGNVGMHYRAWRYAGDQSPTP